jgi:hypothetical protein
MPMPSAEHFVTRGVVTLCSYASPAIVKVDGKDHVVMVTSSINPFQRTSPDNELDNVVGMDPLASRVGGRNQNWAPLALAGGRLLLRDQTQLKCLNVAQ